MMSPEKNSVVANMSNITPPTSHSSGSTRADSSPRDTGLPDQSLSAMSGNSNVAYSEKFLQHYFDNFHDAHPVLLPMSELLRNEREFGFLLSVASFIGSHFSRQSHPIPSKAHVQEVLTQASNQSPFKVQALMLYAISLHGRNGLNEQQEAIATLNQAIDIALNIGLYSKNYAILNGYSDASTQESLRRTWWELYSVDAMLAAFHHSSDFRTSAILADVELPLDGPVARPLGEKPILRTITQLENRFFEESEVSFSSYSYRIEAMKLLGRAIRLAWDFGEFTTEVDAVDAALNSWPHNLPPDKCEVLDSKSGCDELLFQAHEVVQGALVHLHLPRSTLRATRPTNADIKCANRFGLSMPTSSFHTHALKAVSAVHELTRLASLPTNIFRHTPFFICSVVVSAVIQLAACAVNSSDDLEPYRDQVIHSIGILKTLGRVWNFAEFAMKQVRMVAREVQQMGVQPQHLETFQTIQDPKQIEEVPWTPQINDVNDSWNVPMDDINQFAPMPAAWGTSAIAS